MEVLRQLDLQVGDGEFLVLVGPSGCGKSTLLRLLAGLEQPSGGEIYVGSRPVSQLRPAQRDVAMVFQSYALYPHLSVADNIGFGLRRSRRRSLLQQLQDSLHLASRGLPPVSFWAFERPVRELKDGLHAAFEQLELSEAEEAELLEEAEIAFRATQSLLAELAELVPGTATAAASAITPDPAPATA